MLGRETTNRCVTIIIMHISLAVSTKQDCLFESAPTALLLVAPTDTSESLVCPLLSQDLFPSHLDAHIQVATS